MIQAHKAQRRQAKLRLGISGPSGSGKTYSSLLIARGLVGQTGRILLVDTERGSGELYAELTDYDVAGLEPPYRTEEYIEAIQYAEANHYDVVVLDSISHAWAGEGGLLEQVDTIANRTGNKFSSWSTVTPKHQRFVDAMLRSPIHVIATMRSKTEYVLTQDVNGKNKPEKRGLAPIQRDGIDYEFTTVIDIAPNHTAEASKDRTGLFTDTIFVPDESVGRALAQWLNAGTATPAPVQKPVEVKPAAVTPAAPETKQEPKNKYLKNDVDKLRKTYEEKGWSQTIFETAQFDAVTWDKDMILADFKKRNTAPVQKPADIPKAKKCCKCGADEMTPKDLQALKDCCTGIGYEGDIPTMCKDCAREWWKIIVADGEDTPQENTEPQRITCADCGKTVRPEEVEAPQKRYGVALCPTCYKARLTESAKQSTVDKMSTNEKQTAPTTEESSAPQKPAAGHCSKCGKPMSKTDVELSKLYSPKGKTYCKDCLTGA